MDINKLFKIVLIVAILVITGSVLYRYAIYLPKERLLYQQAQMKQQLEELMNSRNKEENKEQIQSEENQVSPSEEQEQPTLPNEPAIQTPSSPQVLPPQQDDSAIKIEKCKAQAQSTIDKFKTELNKLYLQGQETLKKWEVAILDAQIGYSNCYLEPLPSDLIGASPSQITQYRESHCSYYLGIKTELERQLQQERNKLDTLYQTLEKTGQQEYSKIYLECLNK